MRFTIDGSLAMTATGVNSGSPSFTDFAYSNIGFSFSADNNAGLSGRERRYGNGTSEVILNGIGGQASFLNIEQVVILNFTHGLPITNVRLQLDANVSVTGSNSGWSSSGVANAANTATWGGFGAVFDASGNPVPVSEHTFSSGSGTNFAQPVPEPSACEMLGFGGAAMLLQLRRRRKVS